MSRRRDLHDVSCVNHPNRAAVEKCEVCGKSLCNYCLYYTDDGQRLCEAHAYDAELRGKGFNPPETYQEGIEAAQASAAEIRNAQLANPFEPTKGAISGPIVLYRANNSDLLGFIAMLAGVFTVLSLCSFGFCVPIVGAMISIMALLNSKDAVEKGRVRLHGVIGLAATASLLLLWILGAAICYSASISANNVSGLPTLPIDTPTQLPTRTRSPIITLTPPNVPSPTKLVPTDTPEPTDETPIPSV